MPAGTQISVEEYLHTAYSPDRDYVDGRVEERNVGEREHSWVQASFVYHFRSRWRETGLAVFPEWRFHIAPTRFRVPEVIVTRGHPKERILTADSETAPLLCIEILSPEDTVSRVNEKIHDYLSFGVPVVWVVDPDERRIWIYRQNGMEQAMDVVRLDGTEVEIPFSEIFE